ncbi:MAG: hypothetical protein HZB91_09820 [Elusimicrobia bacterium]|nr:hypothetical protein [Elusimicrobiota bacterium]
MADVFLNGRRIKLDPSRMLGAGGEAEVYDIGSGMALKVYKGPDHPDYRGLPGEVDAARERLRTRPAKLKEFPSMPPRVVAPLETAKDRAGRVVGYAMKIVPNAESLLRWSEPGFRRAVPLALTAPLFLDLHATVSRVHEAGVVIGDFNDLNVLVSSGLAHLIDADSFQFGAHRCPAYTERFVDPTSCGPRDLRPVRPHTSASDWYAFDALLFQALLLVHPYGGVLAGGAPHSERVLNRVTVLDPRVRYPRPAIHWRVLPDEVLQRFYQTFVDDQRSPFPRPLLESLRWTVCPSCKAVHARLLCPTCAGAAVGGSVRQMVAVATSRGSLTVTRLLVTEGEVVAVTGGGLAQGGWLVFKAGEFRREDGSVALSGPLRPGTRYFLENRSTVAVGPEEAFAFAGGRSWWERDGALWHEGPLGDERVGEVLAGRTRFWVGPEFGFGFYRAGGVTVAFVFEGTRRGLCDGVPLPTLRGRVLDSLCVFGPGRAWLFLEMEEAGRIWKRCVVIRRDGTVAAAADAPAWLESIHGACAAGPFLFVPTDKGLVRVEESLSACVEFPETEPFVDAGSLLAAGDDGILVAGRHEVVKLSIKKEGGI